MHDISFVALSGLMTFVLSGATAILVFKNHVKNAPHITWSLFSALVSMWGMALFFAFVADEKNEALFWSRFLNYVAIFIPAVFVHFIYSFLDKAEHKQKNIIYAYGITFAYFIATLVMRDQFVADVVETSWFEFYPTAGYLYYAFPLLFGGLVTLGMIELLIARKKALSEQRLQIDYLLIALTVGFAGGGTTFPLVFGIEIYPFGAIGVALLDIIFAYTIIKFRLLDLSYAISKIIGRLIVYSIIIAVFFGAYLLMTNKPDVTMIEVGLLSLSLIAFCEAFGWLKNSVQKFPDKLILHDAVDYQTSVQFMIDLLDKASSTDDVVTAIKLLFEKHTSHEVMSVYFQSSLFDYEEEEPGFHLFYSPVTGTPSVIKNEHELVKIMLASQTTVKDEDSIKLKELFAATKSQACIPFLTQSRLFGFVFIKRAPRRTSFTYNDKNIFDFIDKQVGVTLFRILTHLKDLKALKRAHEEKMHMAHSMAGAISHEARKVLQQMVNIFNEIWMVNTDLQDLKKVEEIDNHTSIIDECIQKAQARTESGSRIMSMLMENVRTGDFNKANFRSTSIKEAIETAVRIYPYEAEADKKGVIIKDTFQDFTYNGEPELTVYIFLNLMKNAFDHYKEIGKPETDRKIVINAKVENGSGLVTFKDNGLGIPEDKLDAIFESFYSTKNTGKGTGLGLSFCRRVMSAFSGAITCSSERGKGSVFTLKFPLNQLLENKNGPAKEPEKKASKPFDMNKLAVLVVDDQATNRAILKAQLTKLKTTLYEAENGQEAIDFFKDKPPHVDVILMDIEMPIMNGFSAAEELRDMGVKTPIIALTGYDSEEDKKKIYEGGMNAVVGKPYQLAELLDTIKKLFEKN